MKIKDWIVAAAVLLLAACGRNEPIRYDGKTVTATGWEGDSVQHWDRILRVYASPDPAALQVLGDYERHGSRIVFRPKFQPTPDVTLRVVYRRSDGSVATALFPGKGGVKLAATTRVTAIYPSTDVWPANTLKFYLEFSAPMSRGQAWTHIQVLDDKGQAVRLPFVEIDQELWDPAGRRLTVLFDPGRIKRGLIDHDDVGAPFVAGRRYTIKVNRDWTDAGGQPLASGFDKVILAGADVRLPVEPNDWKISVPTPNQALVIQFPHPMDQALARFAISVRRDGKPVTGKATLSEQETRWAFVPDRAWAPGEYQIHVEGILEDLAGNRLRRLFDVDTTDPTQTVPPPPSVDVPFRVEG